MTEPTDTPGADDTAPAVFDGTVLPAEPMAPKRRSRKLWWGAGAGVVAIIALGGAGAYAVSLLGGGGAHPEDRLPSSTLAIAAIDLDPSAGQKIQAFRFLRHFDGLKDAVSDDKNLVDLLFEQAVKEEPAFSGMSFDNDIKPWLGKRAAVAAVQLNGKVEPAFVVQVTNESKAKGGLTNLLDASDGTKDGQTEDTGFVVSDGYAVISDDTATAQAIVDAAKTKSLASDERYLADLSGVGGPGIVTGWFDTDALTKAAADEASAISDLTGQAPVATQAPTTSNAGRSVFALRFTDKSVELAARGYSANPQQPGTTAPAISVLPDDTVAAIGWRGTDTLVGPAWDKVQTQLKDAGLGSAYDFAMSEVEAAGFKLPDDLQTLLGSTGVVAVSPDVAVGARVVTDPDKGLDLFNRAMALDSGSTDSITDLAELKARKLPDGIVMASTPQYLLQLSTPGTLGNQQVFKDVVPDAGTAVVTGFFNPVQFANLWNNQLGASGADDPEIATLKEFAGFGFTLGTDSQGWTLRARALAS